MSRADPVRRSAGSPVFGPAGTLYAEVIDTRPAADGVLSVRIASSDGRRLPAWSPRAHIKLWDGGHRRRYSLSGIPGERSWRFTVVTGPDDRAPDTGLHLGARVRVGGPLQTFPLVPAPDYLFVAGGVGLAPFLPMIAAVHRRRTWRLVLFGRTRSALPHLDELAGYGSRVAVRPTDEYGPVDPVDALAGVGERTAVYCCGPARLLAGMTEAADRRGCELHVDRLAAPQRPVGRSAPG